MIQRRSAAVTPVEVKTEDKKVSETKEKTRSLRNQRRRRQES